MKNFFCIILLLAFPFCMHAQAFWSIENPKLSSPPMPPIMDANGTYYWPNKNNNNHLSYHKQSADTIIIVVMDYDRPDHPSQITELSMYRDKVTPDKWWVKKIMITAYGKQPDGKLSPR